MTLDGLGSDPESVLAVVTYFDTLDDQGCGAADLVRAARLLGFDESRDVRVLAVSTDSPDAVAAVLGVLGGERVRTATMGTTVAVLHQGARDGRSLSDALEDAIGAAFPVPGSGRGPWVGIGSATPF